jgi:hypothetical protein
MTDPSHSLTSDLWPLTSPSPAPRRAATGGESALPSCLFVMNRVPMSGGLLQKPGRRTTAGGAGRREMGMKDIPAG